MLYDDLKWRTKNGQLLDPRTMDTTHIRNTLAMLRRAGFIGAKELGIYLSTPGPQGDFAQMAFDMEFAAIMDKPMSPFIDLFEEILKEREHES